MENAVGVGVPPPTSLVVVTVTELTDGKPGARSIPAAKIRTSGAPATPPCVAIAAQCVTSCPKLTAYVPGVAPPARAVTPPLEAMTAPSAPICAHSFVAGVPGAPVAPVAPGARARRQARARRGAPCAHAC